MKSLIQSHSQNGQELQVPNRHSRCHPGRLDISQTSSRTFLAAANPSCNIGILGRPLYALQHLKIRRVLHLGNRCPVHRCCPDSWSAWVCHFFRLLVAEAKHNTHSADANNCLPLSYSLPPIMKTFSAGYYSIGGKEKQLVKRKKN